MKKNREVEVLLIEDDPGDVELTREGLKKGKIRVNLTTVDDGLKAMQLLRREKPYQDSLRPDLILLDLNLPKKDGKEVLFEIKSDEDLKNIPVVVLTTSPNFAKIVTMVMWQKGSSKLMGTTLFLAWSILAKGLHGVQAPDIFFYVQALMSCRV